MESFSQGKQGICPPLEPMILDSSSTSQNFFLFSNGATLQDPNHSRFPFIDNDDIGERNWVAGNERRRKKKRMEVAMETEKPKDVVHVQAKRGQATDSHSLAERTMGMAVMLDVIINYIRNLQNQIEGADLYDFEETGRITRDIQQGEPTARFSSTLPH